jgi:hypothetical protein
MYVFDRPYYSIQCSLPICPFPLHEQLLAAVVGGAVVVGGGCVVPLSSCLFLRLDRPSFASGHEGVGLVLGAGSYGVDFVGLG